MESAMNHPEVGYAVDPILLPFLSTGNEREAAHHLNELVACAAPAIANITRSSRTPDDAFQEAAHSVIRQLRELRARRTETPIGNYLRYARVVASRVVKGQVRREHPGHRSLVDALRHILNRTPSLALWESQGQRVCEFAAWRHQQHGAHRSE